MWHGYLDHFKTENLDVFKTEENLLHEETIALAFLANSNKNKFDRIIAKLNEDFLKKEN